jgi:hypothetical protein
MTPDTAYKQVPRQLLAETLGRSNASAIDPMLCGYQRLLDRLRVPRIGVIHLGGHLGQELPMYAALGFRNVVMVEPLPQEYAELAKRVDTFNATCGLLAEFIGETPASRAHAVRCAVSDHAGAGTFYRTRMTSLSSLARPRRENFSDLFRQFDGQLRWYQRPLAWWRNLGAVSYDRIQVTCMTLDGLIEGLPHGWRAGDFSYLRMNIQGSELNALRGGETALRHLSLIDLEINIEERYEGAPGRREFDEFLNARGFVGIFGYRIGPMGNLVYARRELAGA